MSWNDLRKGRFSQTNGEYFITFNTHNKTPYFYNFELACLFCQQISSNEHAQQCTWLAWVLMPNHFHGLLSLNNESSKLSKTLGALKGRSAFSINQHLKRKGRLWQPAFYERALRAEDDRLAIARYIIANPLRKGLVKSVKDYPFWNSVYL